MSDLDRGLIDDFCQALMMPCHDRAGTLAILSSHPAEAYAALDRIARNIDAVRSEITRIIAERKKAEAEKAKP